MSGKNVVNMAVVCIYNNEEILNNYLLKSLKEQTVECEVKLFCGKKLTPSLGCAAAIYNSVIAETAAEVIVCVHQDISFLDNDALERIYFYLSENRKTILGCAGVQNKKHFGLYVFGNVVEGPHGEISRLHSINEITDAVSVDECMFAFNRKVFETVHFDEKTCCGWHFYTSDFCYSASEYGINIVVYPVNILHLSTGKLKDDFYIQMERIRKKYKHETKYYYSTCVSLNTSVPAVFYKFQFRAEALFFGVIHKIVPQRFLDKIKQILRRQNG